MDGDRPPSGPGPSRNFASGQHCGTNHMDLVPPCRQEDEDVDAECGVRRIISSEQLEEWNTHLFEKGFVKCPLPNCGIMFHGSAHIQNHYITCTGRCEDAFVECTHCQAIVTAEHIQQHMKAMHRLDQSPQPSSDSGSSEVARATGVMERERRPSQKSGTGTSVVSADDDDGRDFRGTEACAETKEQSFKFVNREQMERQWLHELNVSGFALCPVEGCNLGFPSLVGISQHFQHCLGKSQEVLFCELCSKRFVSVRMLNDHMVNVHGEDRVKIRIRNLDTNVTDYNIRRRLVEGDDSERRRRSGNVQVYSPMSMEDEVSIKFSNEGQWKQRDYVLVSHSSESPVSECYLPQASQSVYSVPKNHPHHREVTGPSMFNIASSVKTPHSVPKPHRILEYEKEGMSDSGLRYEPPSAFHRVKDKNSGEQRILKVYDSESNSSSRMSSLSEPGLLFNDKEEIRETISSDDPFFRPKHNQPLRTYVRKLGSRSPVYPGTSGIKRKYAGEHFSNIYETAKNRKYIPNTSYSAGYTSDESEDDGRLHAKYEMRHQHSPVIHTYPRSLKKTEVHPGGARPIRRDHPYNSSVMHTMQSPYVNYSKKQSNVFERPMLVDESSYSNPKCSISSLWEEEEGMFIAPVHIKKRELAERAQQLKRVEEAVKQQEEEAQERTWRALREQELALREKEEALKQREAAAQKKFEEATRMMEETRKLGDSKKFKEDQGFHSGQLNIMLSAGKRKNSPSLSQGHGDRGNPMFLNDLPGPADVTKRTDSSMELQNIYTEYGETESISQENANDEMNLQSFGESSDDKLFMSAKNSCSQDDNELLKSLNNQTSRQSDSPCNRTSPLQMTNNSKKNYPWQLGENIPSIEPSKVVRTYSRRRSSLIDPGLPIRTQSLTPNSKIPFSNTENENEKGETVVNGGATVTITPLVPSVRPSRPYSAIPNMQPTGQTEFSETVGLVRSRPTSALENRIDIPVSVTITEDDEELPRNSPITQAQKIKLPVHNVTVMRLDSSVDKDENILCEGVKAVEQTSKRKKSKDTCIILGKGESCSKKKGRNLSMISLAGVSIPGQTVPAETAWETNIQTGQNLTSTPVQIVRASPVVFSSMNKSAKNNDTYDKFAATINTSGHFSNICLDLSLDKTKVTTSQQEGNKTAQSISVDMEQDGRDINKQYLPCHKGQSMSDELQSEVSTLPSLIDLSVNNPAIQNSPLALESNRSESSHLDFQEQIYDVRAKSPGCNRDSVSSPSQSVPHSTDQSVSPNEDELSAIKSLGEDENAGKITSPIQCVTAIREGEMPQIDIDPSGQSSQALEETEEIQIQQQESSEDYTGINKEQKTEMQGDGQEYEIMNPGIEQTNEQKEMTDNVWTEDQLEENGIEQVLEHPAQNVSDFVPVQEFCTELKHTRTYAGDEGESVAVGKECPDSIVPVEQEKRVSFDSENKSEGNIDVSLPEGAPHIIGEFDPATGTFISNNPALLKSVLGNTVTYPLGSLPEGMLTHDLNCQIASDLPVINQMKQISVQSQTDGVLEQEEFSQNQSNKGQTDSYLTSNEGPYECERKSFIKEDYAECSEAHADSCQESVTSRENNDDININRFKAEEDSYENIKETVISELQTEGIRYELPSTVDEEVSNNGDNMEVYDTEPYSDDECTDGAMNSNLNKCLATSEETSEYVDTLVKGDVIDSETNLQMPVGNNANNIRSPDNTIMYPPIYVTSGISENSRGNVKETVIRKMDNMNESESEIVGSVEERSNHKVCEEVNVQGSPLTDEIDNLEVSKTHYDCATGIEEENIAAHTQDDLYQKSKEAGVSRIISRGRGKRKRGSNRRVSYTKRYTRRKTRGRGKATIFEMERESETMESDVQLYGNNMEETSNLTITERKNGEIPFAQMDITDYEATQVLSRREEGIINEESEIISLQENNKCGSDVDYLDASSPQKEGLFSIGSPDYTDMDISKPFIMSDMCRSEEERIEHVSRGGRKLKLKEWWTGVVTESLSPRSRTNSLSKSPRSSSAKSPIRSPTHIPSPRQLLQVKEERRASCSQEEENHMNESFIPDCSVIGSIAVPDVSLQEVMPTTNDISAEQREILPNENVIQKPKKRGRQRKVDQQSLPDAEKVEIKCGKCDAVSYARPHFQYHTMIEHNGLARPAGENQYFTEAEIKDRLNKTIKAIKKLKCGGCSNLFRSLLGYKKHTEICGKTPEELNTKCKICSKEMRCSSLPSHMRIIHSVSKRADSKKMESNKIIDTGTNPDRPRRKAAANCNERLKVWRSNRTGESGSDNSDAEEDFDIALEPGKFYSKPNFEDIPEELRLLWESQLASNSEGSCTNEGCQFIFLSIPQAKSHYYLCPHSGTKRVFSCKNCEYTSQTEKEMKSHVTSIHIDLTTGVEEESDYDFSDDESDIPCRRYRSYARINSNQLAPFEPAMQWTSEFLNESTSDNLFTQYFTVKSDWVEMDDQLSEKYLSSIKQSPKFKVKQTNELNTNIGREWRVIQQLSSDFAGGKHVMFCGGPVISSAWCTLPPKASLATHSQYLALSTLKYPDKQYPVLKSFAHEGCIQIWEHSSENDIPVKFVFGIAHEHGNVWSLSWCPSGIYEYHLEEQNSDCQLKRLGLLAAAFSDGFIRIYVIPHPSQLKLLGESKIFKLQAKVILSPGMVNKSEAQCLSLDWFKGNGHTDIAGAFSDGVVCLWDISLKSSFFYVKDQEGNFTVYPRNSFQAHNGVCSVVAFCNTTDGRNLLTGGNDRTYKFWDLNNIDMPLSITRKGLVLDAVWLSHWAGAFVSFDDVYGLTNTSTSFRECGFFGIQSRNVLSSNAPVWSLSGSEWLNAIVQGDSSGEVVITIQQQLFRNYENDKFPSKRKVPLIAVRLEHLEQGSTVSFKSPQDLKANSNEKLKASLNEKSKLKSNEKSNSKNKKAKKSRNSKDKEDQLDLDDDEGDGLCTATYIEWPHTYIDACKDYGVVFSDQDTQDFAKIPVSEMDERRRSSNMEPGPVACFPLMSSSSVAWNNNLGAHTSIFVGTVSGLCRIVEVAALNTSEGQNFINSLNR